ncbi:MAG: ABC transporter substrate-binding protein, partial [Nitrosopumilus sp.]|nr:ABC transporter substrate-binding protein [Nitrosopumilus sp.]
DNILYFLTNSNGDVISSNTIKLDKNNITIDIPSEITKDLGVGGSNIKVFAISNSVLKPDFYESSFIVTENDEGLPTSINRYTNFSESKSEIWSWAIPLVIIVGIIIILKKRHYARP